MAIKLNEEIAKEQACLHPGKGTRDQILNFKIIIEKNRQRRIDVFLYFIDLLKPFDMVVHDILWYVIKSMGFSIHMIQLTNVLYG